MTIDTDFSPPPLSEPLRVENLRRATLACGFKGHVINCYPAVGVRCRCRARRAADRIGCKICCRHIDRIGLVQTRGMLFVNLAIWPSECSRGLFGKALALDKTNVMLRRGLCHTGEANPL